MFEQVVGTAVAYLDLNTTGFNTKLKSAWTDMNTIGDKSLTLGQKIQGVGNSMQTIGNEMTKSFTLPIVGAFGIAVAKTTEFEKAMSTVQSLAQSGMQDVAKETDMLRQKAIELGGSTKFTSKEVADAFSYMALAGWDTEQMLENISSVLDLAASSDMDLARASDIVTDSVSAFSKQGTTAAEIVDMMAYAQANANTTTEQLGEGFSNAAANMNTAGQSASTTIAIMSKASQEFLKGAQGGTALSAVSRDLVQKMFKVKDAAEAADYAEQGFTSSTGDLNDLIDQNVIQIGKWLIPLADAKGNFRDFLDIFDDIERAVSGLGSLDATAALMDTFTSRSIKEVKILLNEDIDSIREFRNELENSTGTAAEQAQTRLDNLAGSLTFFKSALDNLLIQLGERLTPYIRQFADKLTELTSKLASMSEEQFDKIMKIGAAIAALGPALSILGKLVTLTGGLFNLGRAISNAGGIIKVVGGAFKTFGTNIVNVGEAFKLARAGFEGFASQTSILGAALGSITAPMIAIVALIGTLIAAFVHLWQTNEEFRNNITQTWEDLKAKFEEAGKKITDAINSLGFDFENIVEVLKAAWEGLCELLAPAFEGAFEIIATVIGGIATNFADFIQIITGLIKGLQSGDWSLFWEGMSNIASDTIDTLLSVFDSLAEYIWNTIQIIGNWFGADWSMTWDEAFQAVANWCEGVLQWFEELPEKIQDFFVGIAEWIVALPDKMIEGIAGIIDSIAQWGSNLVEKGKEAGSNFVDNVVQFFDELPYKIGYAIGFVVATIAQWVVDMVEKAKEFGTNFIQAIVEWFQQLPERIEEFIETTKQNIAQFVTDAVAKAIELGTQFIDNVVQFFQELPGKILEFATMAIENIKKFKDDAIAFAKEAGEKFIQNVVEFITTLPNKVKEFLDKTIENLKQWIIDMGQKGKEAIETLIENIIETAKSIPDKMMEIGKNIVEGVWNGIKEAKDKFVENIQGFFKGIVKGAKDALEIKSPSRVFANEVGKWIPLGIAEGVEEEMPDATNDIQDSIEEGMENVNPEVKLKTSVDTFGDTFVSTFDKLLSWMKMIEDSFIDSINNMTNALLQFANTTNNLSSISNMSNEYESMNMMSNQNDKNYIQMLFEDMFSKLKDFINEFAMITSENASGNNSAGENDWVFPIYLGNELLDEYILTAQQRQNYVSGGR